MVEGPSTRTCVAGREGLLVAWCVDVGVCEVGGCLDGEGRVWVRVMGVCV